MNSIPFVLFVSLSIFLTNALTSGLIDYEAQLKVNDKGNDDADIRVDADGRIRVCG